MDFKFHGLVAFASIVRKDCDGNLIDFKCSIITFDKLMKKYERVTMDFMAKELLKDTGNAQHLFSMSPQNGAGKAGHQIFVKDPQLLDRSLDASRTALAVGAKDTLRWLHEFLLQSLKFYCTAIFEPSVIQQITEELRKAKLRNLDFSWKQIKQFVLAQLIDLSPRCGVRGVVGVWCAVRG